MTILYRAVSQAELNDIIANGFRQHPEGRSFEGKLFATTFEDALAFGRTLYEGEFFRIVQVTIPNSFAIELYKFIADGKVVVAVDRALLESLNALGAARVMS